MSCKHKSIQIYEEITYHGTLVDGVVYFNSAAPDITGRTAVCLDCDESFENVEGYHEEPAHVQDGGKMRVAIQCTDDRTGARGSFGFRTGRNTLHGVRFYSLTPVFDSLVELYGYMKENHIDVDDSAPDTVFISL